MIIHTPLKTSGNLCTHTHHVQLYTRLHVNSHNVELESTLHTITPPPDNTWYTEMLAPLLQDLIWSAFDHASHAPE